MSRSHSKWVFILLILNGVLIEIDNAYKHAMDISNIVMPSAPLLKLPKAFQDSPLAETPMVKQFDGMTMTSGTVAFRYFD